MAVDWDNPTPAGPREVFIDITNACNHKCTFCSNQYLTTVAHASLDSDFVFELIDQCVEAGVKDIGMYATGEPFLRPDLAKYIGYAKKRGIEYVFISTNGALATPEKAKPVLDAGLDSVKFSVNAGTRESYLKVHGRDEFDKVISHIKWFHSYREESGLKYGIYFSMVPTHIAKGEFEALRDLLAPYVDDKDLRGISNQGGNMFENREKGNVDPNNVLGSMNNSQKLGKCPDPFFRCTITPQGFLTPCVVDYQNYLCVADLHKTTLKEAWNNEKLVELRKRHIKESLDGLICKNCLHNCNEPVRPITPDMARPFKMQSWNNLAGQRNQ